MKRAAEEQGSPEKSKKPRVNCEDTESRKNAPKEATESTWLPQHQDCRQKRLFSPHLWSTTLLHVIPTDLYAMIYVYWVHFRATGNALCTKLRLCPPKKNHFIFFYSFSLWRLEKPPLRPSYQSKSKFGSKENLCGPSGIAVDEGGYIFVSDGENHCIQIFRPNGQYFHTFGSSGDLPGQFRNPGGIIFDFDGNFIVLDSGNDRLQSFNSKCQFRFQIGTHGPLNGQLSFPCGVTIDPDSNLMVADTGNHRIQTFNAEGGWIRTFGSYGPHAGELSAPVGIAVDSNRDIVVTEFGNHRIQIFDCLGNTIRVFGRGHFKRPWGLLIAKEGEKSRLVVSDSGNHVIQIFSKQGKCLRKFGWGEMNNPKASAMDRVGNIFIPDCNNQQIQIFG